MSVTIRQTSCSRGRRPAAGPPGVSSDAQGRNLCRTARASRLGAMTLAVPVVLILNQYGFRSKVLGLHPRPVTATGVAANPGDEFFPLKLFK